MGVLHSFVPNAFSAFLLFAGFVFILCLYLKYKHNYWKRRGVPSIPGHWFFGILKDVVQFRTSPSFVFGDIYNQASENDLVGSYLFQKPFLIIRSPELIKQILIKDFKVFCNRYFNVESFHDKIGTSNLFSLKNPEWKYLRTKLTPVFTSGKIKKIFNLMVETAESVTKYLDNEFSDNEKTKSIIVKDIALKYTTDVISSVAFGVYANSFDQSNNQFFRKAQEGLKSTVKRGFQFIIMFFFPALSRYTGIKMLGPSSSYFRKVFWDSMDTRELSKTKRGDLIDFLIDMKNEKPDNHNFKFQGDFLVGQSTIFFIAGRESSVATICFTLYELAKQPDIQKRARDEVLEKLKLEGLTYEAVQNMKYLHQVLSEALRLYPPAPLLDRVATEDYKVPGTDIVIEKGTPIYIPLCGLHRDPKYFPDPLRFDPDRFSDVNKDKIVPGTYLPFGEGPRNCIGMRLGQLQSLIGIITVLKDYELAVDPEQEGLVDPKNVFLQAVDGFRLKLTKL
ncbi:cytochrome P450 6k1 [Calliopsis andreniformis]|uniref:cytochrome P450 6k1 n=1 Tax=Calliopsis andreniformis TaxID=337506 RepID=UPI003FCCBE3F